MEDLRVLAINSFPVHGTAGLKTSMSILGQRVLPVPSVILNGLTNMPDVKKQFVDFEELLQGTFNLVKHRNQKVILSIGYLGEASQVDAIRDAIVTHRDCIKMIFTDPISGDNSRQYVSDEIACRWHELVGLSDYAFPNITELKLLTGFDLLDLNDTSVYVQQFRKKFPQTSLVVTSILEDRETGIVLSDKEVIFKYLHKIQPRNYGGTGDAFLAYFILFHVYYEMPVSEALQKAADKIQSCIANSIAHHSDELLLHELTNTYARSEA
jgi:pyridoxal/pyridoxine/pyridoxamine kinase